MRYGVAALLAVALAWGGPARAADQAVSLKPMPAIAKDAAAFPRLAATDRGAVRINRALDHLDTVLRGAIKECLGDDKQGEWNRGVFVTMRGPRYLSLVYDEEMFCGGAHPDSDTVALVYDLDSGSPVNWARLLPAALVKSTGTDSVGDGTRIGFLNSPVLAALYLKAMSGPALDPECKEVLSVPDLNFQLWPDAKEDGVALQPADLPHAVVACGDSRVIPTTTLRKLGVDPGLLDAIDTAHRQGLFDKNRP